MAIRARRVLASFGLVVLLFVVAVVVLATRTWESPALTRSVLDALSSPELEVDASSVRLSLLRGVEIDGMAVTGRIPGGQLRATVASAVLAHQPMRLLDGEIFVEEITLRQPDAEIVWDAAATPQEVPPTAAGDPPGTPVPAVGAAGGETAPSPGPAGEAEEGWTLSTRVERFGIEGGKLVMREDGVPGEMVRVEGLDLELRDIALPPGAGAPMLRTTAGGKLEATSLTTEAFAANGVTAGLRLAGGHLLVDTLALPTELGPITVEAVDLDLGRDPYVYTLAGVATPIDANQLMGAGAGFGAGTLTFALAGDGSLEGGPRGEGELRLEAGTLGSLPMLAAVEALLAGTDVVGRPYEAFAVPYSLDGELLTVLPFAVSAGNLSLGGSGRIDLAGPLDLRLEVSLPREDVAVKEIPVEVLEALTDVDGRVKLPILVAGSLEAPKVAFDTRAWAAIVQRRLIDEGTRRLGDALLRSFGGNRPNR
jgi:hypothetical protein